MLLTLASAALGASLGLSPQLAAVHTSTRHAIEPAVSAWLDVAPGRWGVGGELFATRSAEGRDVYRYHTAHLRLDALIETSLGSHPTKVMLGVGPALTWRHVHFAAGDSDTVADRLEPGLRARFALEGPLGDHLVFAWHVATTTRGAGLDFDTGLGLGMKL